MPREKRPRRLAWFAMDADAFLDDVRMQQLTNREKGAWLLMLIRAFRCQGAICTNRDIVAEQTGLAVKDAKTLLDKLHEEQLLIPTGKAGESYSPRLDKEIQMANGAYDRYKELGRKSGEKRTGKVLQFASERERTFERTLQPTFEQT